MRHLITLTLLILLPFSTVASSVEGENCEAALDEGIEWIKNHEFQVNQTTRNALEFRAGFESLYSHWVAECGLIEQGAPAESSTQSGPGDMLGTCEGVGSAVQWNYVLTFDGQQTPLPDVLVSGWWIDSNPEGSGAGYASGLLGSVTVASDTAAAITYGPLAAIGSGSAEGICPDGSPIVLLTDSGAAFGAAGTLQIVPPPGRSLLELRGSGVICSGIPCL